jgi:hypothetical protein
VAEFPHLRGQEAEGWVAQDKIQSQGPTPSDLLPLVRPHKNPESPKMALLAGDQAFTTRAFGGQFLSKSQQYVILNITFSNNLFVLSLHKF